MSTHPADFRVEIIKGRPQGVEGIYFQIVGSLEVEFHKAIDPPGEVIDITGRVLREGFGSINRAVDRDLLTFKTGDLTLTARNHDGFFDDLFAFFTPTTIWGLRVYRRGEVQFYGVLVGVGSIALDRKAKTCEMTAYGLTKLLDMTDATLVRRAFAIMAVTTATGGSSSLTLDTTASLATGDVLHLTDHVNAEDVTVKRVVSSTVLDLEAPLAHSYAAGTVVTQTTRFHRYRSIPFLVERLFAAAFVGMTDLRLSPSQFKKLAPTPINISGLGDLTQDFRRGIAQKDGKFYVTLASDATYSQATPDAAWVKDGGGADTRGWMDWSKYYVDGSPEPPVALRCPYSDSGEAINTTKMGPQAAGYDFISSPNKVAYGLEVEAAPPGQLNERHSTDGTTWTAPTSLSGIPTGFGNTEVRSASCEYDPVRNIVVVSCRDLGSTTTFFQYWDVGGAAWTNMKQAGDAASTGYWGPVYCRDLDLILALKATAPASAGAAVGPAFTICAFRGSVLLWERPFPSCYVPNESATRIPMFFPTRTIRYINGSLYCVLISDGAVQLVRSSDQFQTYTMRKLYPSTSIARMLTARANGMYAIAAYKGAIPRGYSVAAPFYAGVIEYADFTGLSAAEALKKLAALCNAVFRVDDDLQGHFVARDLYDPGAVLDIEDRIQESTESNLWDQAVQYARMSGNGFEATAGDASFAADGIELESSFLPNEATAQSLADSYYEFYSAQRRFHEVSLHDRDGTIFRPLDRVTPDGASRFLVYESDHSLVDDEVRVSLLEDR